MYIHESRYKGQLGMKLLIPDYCLEARADIDHIRRHAGFGGVDIPRSTPAPGAVWLLICYSCIVNYTEYYRYSLRTRKYCEIATIMGR